jgi:large subunit ribosomal protein L15
VTPQVLVDAGLIKKKRQRIKILGQGELSRPMVVQAHKFSKSAEEKIRAAGGRTEVIAGA